MARYTYFRIGGKADALVIPKSREDIHWIREAIAASNAPWHILGGGSNVLIADAGLRGIVIDTRMLNPEITLLDPGTETSPPFRCLRTGCSVSTSSLVRRAADAGWKGLEFMCGIPGLIGGAIAMNAGTHQGEVKDALLSVETMMINPQEPEEGRTLSQNEMLLEYRGNRFLKSGEIIYSGNWRIEPSSQPAAIKENIAELFARRKNTQPLDFPSCGSVFKNPKASGLAAWEVINRLGLRGHRIGNAQFSIKHSNFILNLGDAQAADVLALIDLATVRAKSELGIELTLEVKLLGF